ncbi:MAG: hypothetical protein D3923_01780, partial [Candidatus Electrothrix sp. AR3]|nr:hypothetical protein [Candidatus Electrothrix sp. AR3]
MNPELASGSWSFQSNVPKPEFGNKRKILDNPMRKLLSFSCTNTPIEKQKYLVILLITLFFFS